MKTRISALIAALLTLCLSFAAAENMLSSSALSSCQSNSSFSATLFKVAYTPNNNSLSFNILGNSLRKGNVNIKVDVFIYGIKAITKILDPCEQKIDGLCPMLADKIEIDSNLKLGQDTVPSIPGVAYTIPDLDVRVRAYIISTDTGDSWACVESLLTNGQTVDQAAVGWVTAVISGIGLAASAITSGLGHTNTAAHVAANTLALFGYFQSQAFIGMTAVTLPPVVASWTQNFQWTMGIIKVGFVQQIATWYQRATGGTPSTIFNSLLTKSVQVTKRGLDKVPNRHLLRAINASQKSYLHRRTNVNVDSAGAYTVTGIQRVGYRAGIELSNIFMTGYIFFIIFVILSVVGVLAFKGICEILTRMGRMRGDKFKDFRNGWNTVLKGILFRIILLGFPQMVVLCFWEFTSNDSGAEITLAVFTIFSMILILAWASSKVIRLARRSIDMHKNPAYILYSDPTALNKWGFLYVQFKATSYYFITIVLAYILVKGLFIGLAQSSGAAQAIGLVIVEAAFLITVCVMRPYMDKKTNAFNIAIQVINFVSAICLLIFSGIFHQPVYVDRILGVVFFLYNVIFVTVLLIMVLVASVIAIVAKNPDTRYQPMRDDRSSFIKSNTNLNTELDALGATARGDQQHAYTEKSGVRIEDDDDSWSGGSASGAAKERNNADYYDGGDGYRPPQDTGYYGNNGNANVYKDLPRSNNNSSTNLGTDGMSGRHNPPYSRDQTASPYSDSYSRTGSMTSQRRQYKSHGGNANGASPWQRGAGYE